VATTALVVETLIIGFQVLAVIVLLVLVLFGYDWVRPDTIEQWVAPLTVAAFAVAYSLGLVEDLIVRGILNPAYHWFERHSRFTYPGRQGRQWLQWKRDSEKELRDLPEWRQLVYYHNAGLGEALDRRFNQARLAGANAMNFLLLMILGPLFVLIRTRASLGLAAAILLLAGGWMLMSLGAWLSLLRLYYWEAAMAVRVVKAQSGQQASRAD
jgi:hypothetical protein